MSRVYVGRLPTRCSERDIEKFFKGYGRLKDVVLKNGYGFVEFDNGKDADDAVYDLRGRELGGERIIVEHARLPSDSRGGIRRGTGGRDRRFGPPTRTEYRVLVENLSSRVSWQYLKDMMRKAGDVTYADAHKTARNDGIVEFSSNADMKEAIEKFDGYELYGRRLRVYEDRPARRSRSNSRRSASSGKGRKYSNRSRSRDSYRRRKSQSPRRRRDHSNSSDRHHSRDRRDSYKHDSPNAKSRSGSRQSECRVHERSTSHTSVKRSIDRDSRSPSRNGRNGSAKDESRRRSISKAGSGNRSRSRSQSPVSRSPVRSRTPSASRSRSGSRHNHSDSEQQKKSDHEQSENVGDSE